MIFVFSGVFILSIIVAALIIVRKIPLVLSTPRDVVNDYFEESSSRFHIRVLRAKTWVKSGAYWDPFMGLVARFLRRIRVWSLKLDRYSSALLQSVNKKTETRKLQRLQEADPNYWDGLKSDRASDKPKEETTGTTPPAPEV